MNNRPTCSALAAGTQDSSHCEAPFITTVPKDDVVDISLVAVMGGLCMANGDTDKLRAGAVVATCRCAGRGRAAACPRAAGAARLRRRAGAMGGLLARDDLAPELRAQGLLDAAAIHQLRADLPQARALCEQLKPLAPLPTAACLAELDSLSGNAPAAAQALARLSPGRSVLPWLALMRAELAERMGDASALGLYWLLAQNRAADVLALTQGSEADAVLLLRAASWPASCASGAGKMPASPASCPEPVIRALLLLLFCTSAWAHQSSEAYLRYRVDGASVEQRLDIALRDLDLDRDLGLDADGDGTLSWGEVRARWADIERLAGEGVRFTADGAACDLQDRGEPQLDEHSDGMHAVLVTHWHCAAAVHELAIDYRLFAATDAGHRGLARLVGAAGEPLVLLPGAGPQRLSAAGAGLGDFVVEGMAHIASGLDHVLFLVTLLLVAVWKRDGKGWAPRASARGAFTETLKLVTAFTVAHSITLGLAASGAIDPPSRWIESLIALTVLLAALDNLRPFVPGPRWAMVGVFGLVHGVGFAGPLKDLGLRGAELLKPLLGFNVGVELGQLAVVALLLPAALALRRRTAYRRWIVPGGSSAIAALATLWLAERTLQLLP